MIGAALTRAALALALAIVALLFAFAGLGFALAAVYLYLLPNLGAGAAAAVVAFGAFVAAGVLLLALRLRLRGASGRTPAPRAGQAAPAPSGDEPLTVAREAAAWVAEHPGRSMLLALLAGGVLGASPGLRARFERLFDALTRG